MFSYSKYKLHYIEKLVTGEKSTVYRCGTLVDLCRGPHIQNTGKVKTFDIMQVNCGPVQELSGYTNILARTPLHISSVTRAMTHFNVFVELPSPTSSEGAPT